MEAQNGCFSFTSFYRDSSFYSQMINDSHNIYIYEIITNALAFFIFLFITLGDFGINITIDLTFFRLK